MVLSLKVIAAVIAVVLGALVLFDVGNAAHLLAGGVIAAGAAHLLP